MKDISHIVINQCAKYFNSTPEYITGNCVDSTTKLGIKYIVYLLRMANYTYYEIKYLLNRVDHARFIDYYHRHIAFVQLYHDYRVQYYEFYVIFKKTLNKLRMEPLITEYEFKTIIESKDASHIKACKCFNLALKMQLNAISDLHDKIKEDEELPKSKITQLVYRFRRLIESKHIKTIR